MPILQQKEANIYYEEHGEGEPLVLTYGLAGNTDIWQPQVEALSSHHRLILWDQRGHGRSYSPAQPENYGVWTSVEDLHALLGHLSIEKAAVGGQSMGGGVAARFALKYPHKTNALLVFNSHSASGLNSTPQIREMRRRSIEIVRDEGVEAMAEFSMQADPNTMSHLECSPDPIKATKARIRQMFGTLSPIGYINAVIAARHSDDISGRLEEIQTPTLLLTGDKDPAFNSMKFVKQKIPHAELEVIPGAGHHANLDKAESFNDAVLQFLDHTYKLNEEKG